MKITATFGSALLAIATIALAYPNDDSTARRLPRFLRPVRPHYQ